MRADPCRHRGRQADLRPRRLRRGRDLRDRARAARPARARRRRATGTCPVVSGRGTACRSRRFGAWPRRTTGSWSPSTAGSPRWRPSRRRSGSASRSIVTDHHRPGEQLPDCPAVATRPSDYPFPELCGTGVVHKLGQALLGRDSDVLRAHADIVALATIADVVPLVDENRALAIEGLRRLAATQKPGLRAFMRAAHVDPATVDSGAVGFRLAPRINAAGRLGHPGAALELLLTEDADDGAPPRRRARAAEPRAPGRRGHDRARRDGSGRGVAGCPAQPPRLRSGERGVARGRDRDRRLAPGRALPPARRADRRRRAGMERLGPLDSRVRPPWWLECVLRLPRAVRRPPRRSGPLDPSGADRRVRRGVRRPCRGRALGRRPPPGHADRRCRPARRPAHPRPLPGAGPARPVRARQSRM